MQRPPRPIALLPHARTNSPSYNNMKAPNNARGMEDDKASHYNNMFAPLNCVGGSEQGCEPFAVSLSLSLSLCFQSAE